MKIKRFSFSVYLYLSQIVIFHFAHISHIKKKFRIFMICNKIMNSNKWVFIGAEFKPQMQLLD